MWYWKRIDTEQQKRRIQKWILVFFSEVPTKCNGGWIGGSLLHKWYQNNWMSTCKEWSLVPTPPVTCKINKVYHKSNMNKNCKGKQVNLHDFGLGNGFLGKTSKV
jgi:hypothetical protein